MFVEAYEQKCGLVHRLLQQNPPEVVWGNLDHIATEVFAKRERLLHLIQQQPRHLSTCLITKRFWRH